MKEMYFTPENIRTVSKEMLSKYSGARKRHNTAIAPENTALLIIDMQRYFLDSDSHANIPSAPFIIPNIRKLAESFLNRDLPVICTRHINSPENANLMGKWWRSLLMEDDPKSALIPELDIPSAVLLNKTQYDAFYETDLNEILARNHISQVVITGVMTHLCCETTARSAFVRGFNVFLPVDATATYNREFHQSSLQNLSHGFAVPLLTEDVTAVVERL